MISAKCSPFSISKKLLVLSLSAGFALNAKCEDLIVENFRGSSAQNINGKAASLNVFNTNKWAAPTEEPPSYFRADGSVVDEDGGRVDIDRGVYINIGPGMFATNSTYKLTLNFGQLNNSGLFLGFTSEENPKRDFDGMQDAGEQNLAIRVRTFGQDECVSICNRVGGVSNYIGVDNSKASFDGKFYQVVMTIKTNRLTNAEVTVQYGSKQQTIKGVNITSLQTLYYGVEDAALYKSQGLMGKMNSLKFSKEK